MLTSPVCTGLGKAMTDWKDVGPSSSMTSSYSNSIQLKLNGACVTSTRSVYTPSSITTSRLVVDHSCHPPVAGKETLPSPVTEPSGATNSRDTAPKLSEAVRKCMV